MGNIYALGHRPRKMLEWVGAIANADDLVILCQLATEDGWCGEWESVPSKSADVPNSMDGLVLIFRESYTFHVFCWWRIASESRKRGDDGCGFLAQLKYLYCQNAFKRESKMTLKVVPSYQISKAKRYRTQQYNIIPYGTVHTRAIVRKYVDYKAEKDNEFF